MSVQTYNENHASMMRVMSLKLLTLKTWCGEEGKRVPLECWLLHILWH